MVIVGAEAPVVGTGGCVVLGEEGMLSIVNLNKPLNKWFRFGRSTASGGASP